MLDIEFQYCVTVCKTVQVKTPYIEFSREEKSKLDRPSFFWEEPFCANRKRNILLIKNAKHTFILKFKTLYTFLSCPTTCTSFICRIILFAFLELFIFCKWTRWWCRCFFWLFFLFASFFLSFICLPSHLL